MRDGAPSESRDPLQTTHDATRIPRSDEPTRTKLHYSPRTHRQSTRMRGRLPRTEQLSTACRRWPVDCPSAGPGGGGRPSPAEGSPAPALAGGPALCPRPMSPRPLGRPRQCTLPWNHPAGRLDAQAVMTSHTQPAQPQGCRRHCILSAHSVWRPLAQTWEDGGVAGGRDELVRRTTRARAAG